jgi:hypothetical protein
MKAKRLLNALKVPAPAQSIILCIASVYYEYVLWGGFAEHELNPDPECDHGRGEGVVFGLHPDFSWKS